MALQAPTWQALLAFGYGPLDPTPLWTDVTALMLSYDYEEGRMHELDRVEAGQFTGQFEDSYGEFTPGNLLSPYYNLVPTDDALGLAEGNWFSFGTSNGDQSTNTLFGSDAGYFISQTANTCVETGVAYPAAPFTQYTYNVQIEAATAGENLYIGFTWYNSSGSPIGGTNSTPVSDNTTGWTQYSLTATSPANTAYIGLNIFASSATGATHYFTCAMLSYNPPRPWSASGVPVVWNQGQYGPFAQSNPFKVIGTWTPTTENICYTFIDALTPNPKDAVKQTAELKTVDVLGLLGQIPLSSTTYFPSVVDSLTPVGYWRLNDPQGAQQAAPYSGTGGPLTVSSGEMGNLANAFAPLFGNNDVNGNEAKALLTGGFTGSGSQALLYDPSTAAEFFAVTDSGGNANAGHLAYVGALMSGASDWSIAFMANFGTGVGPGQIFKSYAQPSNAGITLGVTSAGNLQLGGSVTVATSTANVLDGQWHYIVVTMPQTGTVICYLDNVAVVSASISATPTNPDAGLTLNNCSLEFGPIALTGVTPANSTQSLTLQDIAVFGSALTSANVRTLYSAYHILQDEEYVGPRILKVLDVIGWNTFPHSFATGTVLLAPEADSQTQTAVLSYIQNLVDVELGFLWQDVNGILQFKDAFYPNTNSTSNTSQVTIGDNLAAGANYDPGVKVPMDSLDLYTDVQVQAQQANGTGQMQEVQNPSAIGPPGGVGTRPLQRTGLPFATDTLAAAQAVVLLNRYSKLSVKRVDSVVLSAKTNVGGSNPGGNIGQMLARQLWDEVTFQRQGNAETLFSAPMLIEKRHHKWDSAATDYSVEYVLSPYEVWADITGTFTLDDPALGIMAGPGGYIAYGVLA